MFLWGNPSGEPFAHPERHDNPLPTPRFRQTHLRLKGWTSLTPHGFVLQNPMVKISFSPKRCGHKLRTTQYFGPDHHPKTCHQNIEESRQPPSIIAQCWRAQPSVHTQPCQRRRPEAAPPVLAGWQPAWLHHRPLEMMWGDPRFFVVRPKPQKVGFGIQESKFVDHFACQVRAQVL